MIRATIAAILFGLLLGQLAGCTFVFYESEVKVTPELPAPSAEAVAVQPAPAAFSPANVVAILKILPLKEWFTGMGEVWQSLIQANQAVGVPQKMTTKRSILRLEWGK